MTTPDIVGVALTALILSYLLWDSPLYRLALHLFVGALVGYSFGIVLRDVLYDMLLIELQGDQLLVIPLALGILLLFKGFPRQAYIGNFSIAYLIGVGTAVALSGTLLGAIVPQVEATGRALSSASLGPLDGLMIVVGTVCTLMAFTFTASKRQGLAGVWTRLVRAMGWVGRIFLIVTFGVAFAGALTASLSIFIGRVQYILDFVAGLYFP